MPRRPRPHHAGAPGSEIEAATSDAGWGAVGKATPTTGALRITGAAGFIRAAGIPRRAAEQPLTLTVGLDVVAGGPIGSVPCVAAAKAERTTGATRTSGLDTAHALI